MIWGRIGIYSVNQSSFLTVSLLNVGFVGTMKFTEVMGLEAALNTGLNIYNSFDSVNGVGNEATRGMLINPEVKFRYKVFAVGLDLAIMTGLGGSSTTIGISGGFRF